MFLSELRIENFRIFGEGEEGLVLSLRPGLTALVGENDTGKTAVIDALRLVLGTRDQEFARVDETDFHQPSGSGDRRKEIRVRCKFDGLTVADRGAFAEHLTFEDIDGAKTAVLYLNWKATAATQSPRQRRFTWVESRSGKAADGPQFDPGAKALLIATYLRPLRDAERGMSAGRGSRLSQILQHTKEVGEHGTDYDPQAGPPNDLSALSVRGIGDLADDLITKHDGIRSARKKLNVGYLQRLSFAGDTLEGQISVGRLSGGSDARLRALLEKLDLVLRDSSSPDAPPNRGLGSNNLLFMACELLLLGSETDGHPLLLIEEPEAHLHPQRQLRLIEFLQQQADEVKEDSQRIQIVLTTHSPNLASAINLDNLVMLNGRQAFPLAEGCTQLDRSDYGFLARFLDVTKANLFFARGLLIVEGDAENILIPTLARLLDRDLTASGVSIVNVGGTGLGRFARIYLRSYPDDEGIINVPVACLADFDVMPDCAPEIVGYVAAGEPWPTQRRWKVKSDFTDDQREQHRHAISQRASGQNVRTFVANEWTFEYDLAYSGLGPDLWIAANLAAADGRISLGDETVARAMTSAAKSYAELVSETPDTEEFASRIYALVGPKGSASKAVTAQYLANFLEIRARGGLTPDQLRTLLPRYIVDAIDHVTCVPPEPDSQADDSE